MAGSSSDCGLGSCKYDVFISFRGTDTRTNFVSHLYNALLRKKIKAYKDDVSLQRGDQISPALLKAIQDSKIAIVVLSDNYATSRWCLEELVRILECKRERGQIVLPVFYGVDPSDVREQKGSYASAFVEHEKRFEDEMEKVLSWRLALAEVGNLSGWDSRQNRSDSELVEEIAQVTLLKLYNMSSTSRSEFERNLVGMEERINKIESLLRVDSQDVCVLGIWGMGGIGKSTLAEALGKRFSSRFESCVFIDVSNEVKRCGLRRLRRELFSALLEDRDVNMNNTFTDVRLRRKKVFVVLDNVDDVEQLEHLIGVPEQTKSLFGKGSKVIVTSRDEKILKESADVIYKVDGLDSDESLRLFYQNAFGRDSPNIIDYIELSKIIVDYAGGNPLALKVLGSHLHSRGVKEWESALSKLKKAPNEKVQKVLKISYDALDGINQSILLDVACFFNWEERGSVECTLDDDSHIGITILVEKSLLTIFEGRLLMHDLVQDMAWEIVRRESIKLGKRSRLWDARDVYSVLEKNKGSARNEGLFLDLSRISKDLCLCPGVFEDMENLRLLKIYSDGGDYTNMVYLHQGLHYLPNSLRYLEWANYPLNSLPSEFDPQNLVKLSMPMSKLEKLWNGVADLGNLKDMTLSGSMELIELPDLSKAPKLARMDLSFCISLLRFPKMSGSLNYLDMQSSGVRVFDSTFKSLENLECVILAHCDSLESLPKFPSNVRTLHLSGVKSFTNLAIDMLIGLHSLTYLNLGASKLSHIPEALELLPSIETLDLSRNDLVEIPTSIKHMSKLKKLYMRCCNKLERVAILPSSLQVLETGDCASLKMISVRGLTSLKVLDASSCKSLVELVIDEPDCTSWKELLTSSRHSVAVDKKKDRTFSFSFVLCSNLKQSSKDNILTQFKRQVFGVETTFHLDFDVTEEIDWPISFVNYSGNEIPKWFEHQSKRSSINVHLRQQRDGMKFIGFVAAVVLELENIDDSILRFAYAKLSFKTHCGTIHECHKTYCNLIQLKHYSGEEEMSRMSHVLMWHCYSCFSFDIEKELQDYVTVALFEFELKSEDESIAGRIRMKKCGIHVITLNEALEFGFNVDEQKVSIKPAQKSKQHSSQENKSLRIFRRLQLKEAVSNHNLQNLKILNLYYYQLEELNKNYQNTIANLISNPESGPGPARQRPGPTQTIAQAQTPRSSPAPRPVPSARTARSKRPREYPAEHQPRTSAQAAEYPRTRCKCPAAHAHPSCRASAHACRVPCRVARQVTEPVSVSSPSRVQDSTKSVHKTQSTRFVHETQSSHLETRKSTRGRE